MTPRPSWPATIQMRDLFDELFANAPLDPIEAVRRSGRPNRRRRLYQLAEVAEHADAFAVLLDGRGVKSPARRALVAPSRAVAEALAAEWNAQGDFIDPGSMPLTRLVNSIIDGVVDAPEGVKAEIEKYLGSDLLFYRAPGPAALVARQAEAWDPLLDWARKALLADFLVGEGVGFVRQPEAALRAAGVKIPREPWQLGAVHAITTLTGSALIAL